MSKNKKQMGNEKANESKKIKYDLKWFKSLNHGLLIALAGLGTTIISLLFTFVWLPNLSSSSEYNDGEIYEWIQTLNVNSFIGIVFVISLMALVPSILVRIKRKIKLILGIGTIVLIILNFVGVLWVLGNGILNTFYILVVWMTVYVILLLFLILFKELNLWLLIKEDEKNDFNVAKLTLLWAIIVFIITQLLN